MSFGVDERRQLGYNGRLGFQEKTTASKLCRCAITNCCCCLRYSSTALQLYAQSYL